jgi:hypothetical protein
LREAQAAEPPDPVPMCRVSLVQAVPDCGKSGKSAWLDPGQLEISVRSLLRKPSVCGNSSDWLG